MSRVDHIPKRDLLMSLRSSTEAKTIKEVSRIALKPLNILVLVYADFIYLNSFCINGLCPESFSIELRLNHWRKKFWKSGLLQTKTGNRSYIKPVYDS